LEDAGDGGERPFEIVDVGKPVALPAARGYWARASCSW
jgi:hypothetical protein